MHQAPLPAWPQGHRACLHHPPASRRYYRCCRYRCCYRRCFPHRCRLRHCFLHRYFHRRCFPHRCFHRRCRLRRYFHRRCSLRRCHHRRCSLRRCRLRRCSLRRCRLRRYCRHPSLQKQWAAYTDHTCCLRPSTLYTLTKRARFPVFWP
ncbi:pentapeptide repeat-containing protein [Paenibacillus tyrfis]|uniref:pentapeptide repeat-containing protein n=1 Tax=Paenibacillus tyrfis TaxID=1501230 RepID=UPI0035B52821